MTKEQLLNHYRNLYQVVKRDKDEIERELEEYKTLASMQQDIINNLNKRINILKRNHEVLENNLNMLLENTEISSELKINVNSLKNVQKIRIN